MDIEREIERFHELNRLGQNGAIAPLRPEGSANEVSNGEDDHEDDDGDIDIEDVVEIGFGLIRAMTNILD